jgi:hypothetical protein
MPNLINSIALSKFNSLWATVNDAVNELSKFYTFSKGIQFNTI